ncbi:hypothetical protein D3C72_1876670 [compost metagenome]
MESSCASLTRWASPPDRVVALWPRRMYDRPTSNKVCSLRAMVGTSLKKVCASSTVMSRICAMFWPFHCTCRVSRL